MNADQENDQRKLSSKQKQNQFCLNQGGGQAVSIRHHDD